MPWIKGERKLPQERQDKKDRTRTGNDRARTKPRQVKVRDKIVQGQGQDRTSSGTRSQTGQGQ
jgi:hypothetical protein